MLTKIPKKANNVSLPLPILRALGKPWRGIILLAVLFILSLVGVALASIYYGMELYKTKAAASYNDFWENTVETRWRIVPNYVKGNLFAKPERIAIEIGKENFQKLAHKRAIALATRILTAGDDDFVPAKIHHQDKTVDAKIRLKGDWVDHLLGEKWSFRIVIKGDDTLLGMKQFSIHHPRARHYVYEWIFHQALRRESIMALRYDFVNVTLNGKDLGVYALEEHFEKRLIEHNHFREGPIIKYNEELLWNDRAMHLQLGELGPTGLQSENSSNVDAFKMGRLMGDAGQYRQFIKAYGLLEAFRYSKLPTHKVFDVEKLAKFFALSDLMGAEHAVVWHNLRFYYNPMTSKLEPIGFDGNAGHQIAHVIGSNRALYQPPHKFKDLAFSDPVFYEAYIKALLRLSAPGYLDSLFSDLQVELEKKLNILYSEFPHFYFTKSVFYNNQQAMRNVLQPAQGLHAYFNKAAAQRLTIDLGNIQAMPLQVIGVSFKDEVPFSPTERIILQPMIPNTPVNYQSFDFALPSAFVWSDTMKPYFALHYKVLGTTEVRRTAVNPWPHDFGNFAHDLFRLEPNLEQFAFLRVVDSTRKIIIQPGDWKLDKALIIPAGYRVICGEGTRLDLSQSANIISYSPLEWRGSEASPIIISSKDSTGAGLFVLQTTAPSFLEYVTFANLSNPAQEGWALTGAVTFYEAEVHIANCQFINNRCEDAVNLVRGKFTIDKSLFKNAKSDAFDADFGTGRLTRLTFLNCGNDAIDVAGSVAEIDDILIRGAGDKGISGGENSQVQARHIDIKHAEISIASKDKTALQISNVKLDSCGVGFMAYVKKPEFGAGAIIARNVKMRNCRTPFLIENNSSMTLDGEVIPPSHDKVESILYGAEFGKASKPAKLSKQSRWTVQP
ncbi:MAG: CotH kinase family protein [candidate division KSB1 bacterium]|nr:CotH kinase family protein [candidate division KSB1 bacterium]MDZ7365689.1 CotH kinase family protein [candidate division KSB1 bacterium]MDZ7403235.1 CotH kinase family protein [candidate division KSB1 bacterium]